MADNIAVNAGSGPVVAADDVSSVYHQLVKVEWGLDGVATMVSTSNPLPITGVTMPAAARTTDHVGATDVTDALMNGYIALTPKFAKTNVAASSTDAVVVTAVGGKKIRVLLFRIHAGAVATDVTFNTKPAGAGTANSEKFALGANGGHSPGYCPLGHFSDTGTGEGLSVTTSAGSTVGIGCVYVEI